MNRTFRGDAFSLALARRLPILSTRCGAYPLPMIPPAARWIALAFLALLAGWTLRGWQESRTTSADRMRGLDEREATAQRAAADAHRTPAISSGDEAWLSRRELLQALRQPHTPRRSHDLYVAAQKVSIAEIPALIEQAQRLSRWDAADLVSALVARWAEAEPLAAATFVEQLTDPSLRHSALPIIVRTWASLDLDAAVDWVRALPPQRRKDQVAAVIGAAAMIDAARALEHLKRFPITYESAHTYAAVFHEMAASNPAYAVEQAIAMPEGNSRAAAISAVVLRWSRSDPEAALEWAKSLNDPAARLSNFNGGITAWAERDPERALAYLRAMPDGELKLGAMPQLAQMLVRRSPDAAKALIELMPPGAARADAMREVTQQLAHYDPAAAAEFALTIPTGSERKNAISISATALARTDPEQALTFAGGIGEENARRYVLAAVLGEWGKADPRAAADYWVKSDLPGDIQTQGVFMNIAADWVRNKPVEAFEWAESLNDPNAREAAYPRILGPLAQHDPAKAARLLEKLSGEAQSQAASAIATYWVNHDSDAAARWAATLPERAKLSAFTAIVQVRAQLDAAGTARWLDTLPQGSGRDTAIRSFANWTARVDPAGAAAWAGAIAEPRTRLATYEIVARQWLQYDRTAATEWLERNHELSAETKKKILRSNEERRANLEQ